MPAAPTRAEAEPTPEQKMAEPARATTTEEAQTVPGEVDPFADVDNIVKELIPDETATTDDQEAPPFWAENQHYKDLQNHLNYNGTPLSLLEKFARDIADKSTIDNGKLVTGLENEKRSMSAKIADYENEIIRLREVEREAVFDLLPETEEQFSKPMQTSAETIKNILDIEGSPQSLSKILQAKNKTELNQVLRDVDLDTQQLANVTTQWRLFQETKKSLDDARGEAKQNLKGKLSLEIPPERATDIMRKTLIDLMTTDEKFKYIQTGINEGIENHEEVGQVLSTAQSNFSAMLSAITDPHSVVRNPAKLKQIATYVVKAAHNNYYANKVPDLQSKLTQTEEKFRKVAEAYVSLKKAAGGKVGNSGLPITGRANGNGTTHSPAKVEADKDAENYAKFLVGDAKLEDLLK